MTIRVFTVDNFIDIELKSIIEPQTITEQLEEGNTVVLEESDGNIFILNNLNIVGIKIFKDSIKEKIYTAPIN